MHFNEKGKENFIKLLNPPQGFEYGKIKFAAKYLLDEFGHDWALKKKRSSQEESSKVIFFRETVKKLVYEHMPLHTNKSQTYTRLLRYANELATKREAERIIKSL